MLENPILKEIQQAVHGTPRPVKPQPDPESPPQRYETSRRIIAEAVQRLTVEITAKRKKLPDHYSKHSLFEERVYYQACAETFHSMANNKNHDLYWFINRSPLRRNDILKISRAASDVAVHYERTARQPTRYSLVKTSNKLLELITSLENFGQEYQNEEALSEISPFIPRKQDDANHELFQTPEPIHDDFDYDLEKQEWYCAGPPPFQRINEPRARSYVSQIDLVLMTVNPREFNAIINLLKPFPGHKSVLAAGIHEETYYLGMFGAFNAVVMRTRMGAQQPGSAGMAAQQAQAFWRPRALIALGVAFGIDPRKQRIGDVLVASDIITYHPARIEVRRIERGRPLPSDSILLNRFANSDDWVFNRPDGQRCRVVIGPILSGEEVIDSPIRKAELLDTFPAAIGGEMEGSGIAAVANYNRTPWILVKAICDWADGNKANKYQPLAAAAAADLTVVLQS